MRFLDMYEISLANIQHPTDMSQYNSAIEPSLQ